MPAPARVTPTSVAELSEVLAGACAEGRSVVVCGRGTKLDWGPAPSRLDLLIDCGAMPAGVEHAEHDLVAVVGAAVRLSELAGVLAKGAQRLCVDELVPGSTVGGVVATGLSGPLRQGFGAVRDLVIGITVVRADGVVAKSGGRVVKNVAGYDLAKLFTGSYGTLGVITETIFRLHPLPERTLFVTAAFESPEAAFSAASAVRRGQFVPSGLEVGRDGPGPLELAVLLEGITESVARRAEAVAAVLPAAEIAAAAPGWWASLPGPLTVKATSVLSDQGALVAEADELAGRHGLTWSLRASAGLGVCHLGLGGDVDPEDLAPLLAALRRRAAAAGGSAVVLCAPETLRPGLDWWGPVATLPLMQRVKAAFDPGGVLSPGRFVGGI